MARLKEEEILHFCFGRVYRYTPLRCFCFFWGDRTSQHSRAHPHHAPRRPGRMSQGWAQQPQQVRLALRLNPERSWLAHARVSTHSRGAANSDPLCVFFQILLHLTRPLTLAITHGRVDLPATAVRASPPPPLPANSHTATSIAPRTRPETASTFCATTLHTHDSFESALTHLSCANTGVRPARHAATAGHAPAAAAAAAAAGRRRRRGLGRPSPSAPAATRRGVRPTRAAHAGVPTQRDAGARGRDAVPRRRRRRNGGAVGRRHGRHGRGRGHGGGAV
jgi:hypothetical protein